MKLSIRYKFLFVIGSLLSACLLVYLAMAVQVFKSDKTELVFDLNRSQISNLSSEVETQLEGVSAQFRLFALLAHAGQSLSADQIFPESSDVVYAQVQRLTDGKILRAHANSKYTETYGLDHTKFWKDLLEQKSFQPEAVKSESEQIWNATIAQGPPLVGFARSVVIEDQSGKALEEWVVLGYIKGDRWLKAMSLFKDLQVSLLDHEGQHLLKPYDQGDESAQRNPFFDLAQKSKAKTSVLKIEDRGDFWLGGYSKAYNGKVVVVAQTNQKTAFVAIESLIERSLIFALIVVTAAFLVAILLARSLTNPILDLVEGMESVSTGNLDTQIQVKTKDETLVLAQSFNKMIRDLKVSRNQLEEINRDLDLKVKERTAEVEEKSKKIQEIQEALLRTTRLASAGEIAGRAAHEVLNPLTGILARLGQVGKRMQQSLLPQVQLMKDLNQAWSQDYYQGGFPHLVQAWEKKSEVLPGKNLFEEDLHNLSGTLVDLENGLGQLNKDHEFIAHEGQRISKIVGGMRKLNHVHGDKKVFSGKELLKQCTLIMSDQFFEKGFEISYDLQAPQDQLLVDKDEFIQAVTNLMRNSYQAMCEAKSSHPTYKGKLVLRTSLVDSKEGSQWQFDLEDNGPGIQAADQDKLFQSQFTTKSPEHGTGIGLGISRRFIRAFGGDIQFVHSEPHRSTIFRITLPLARHQEVAA